MAVAKAREGDPDAWDALLRRHQRPLHVFVAEMVRDRATALDVVQETFIAAARHIGGLRDDRKFALWLFGIARQKCIQHWRRSRPETEQIDELDETEFNDGDDPADVVVRAEEHAIFLDALERLPEPQREVLVLHFLEEFSLAEIGGITGIPVGTVKSRIYYARKALRNLMKHEDTPSTPVGTPR